MPHRPFHRLLGETSLELKCLTLFGAFLLLVITASFLSYWIVTETVVKEQNPATGRLLVTQSLLANHWRAFERKEEFFSVVEGLTRDITDKYPVRYLVPDSTQPKQRQPPDDFHGNLRGRLGKAK